MGMSMIYFTPYAAQKWRVREKGGLRSQSAGVLRYCSVQGDCPRYLLTNISRAMAVSMANSEKPTRKI